MTTDLEELKRLCAAATPGPWRVFDEVRRIQVAAGPNANPTVLMAGNTNFYEQATLDVAFTAAANPAVVADLIDQLQKARADAERYRWLRTQPDDTEAPRIDVVLWKKSDESANEGTALRTTGLDSAIDDAIAREKKHG